jgi:hypothetical protein
MPFAEGIYNAAAIGADGKIWGLASEGIFVIDTSKDEVAIIARSTKPITAGFAMSGRAIYFACGPEVWGWNAH